MKKLIISVLLVVAVSVAFAADTTATKEDTKQLNAEIQKLQAIISSQEKTISRARKSVERLKKQLADQEKENRRLRALCNKAGVDTNPNSPNKKRNDIAGSFKLPLKVGQVAYLGKDNRFKITQIIDEKNMLADFYGKGYPGYWRGGLANPKTIWLKGTDTSNHVDGSKIKIVIPLKITGTKTYPTAMGSTNTVFVLEPYIFPDPFQEP